MVIRVEGTETDQVVAHTPQPGIPPNNLDNGDGVFDALDTLAQY
jgi:hypothetical protein